MKGVVMKEDEGHARKKRCATRVRFFLKKKKKRAVQTLWKKAWINTGH